MNLLSNRIIGIDEDWNELLSSGFIKEIDAGEGIVFVTDGKRWGAKHWDDNPIIPIKYDNIDLGGTEYDLFIVCERGNKYDTYDYDGNPIAVGLTNYYARDFKNAIRSFICLANSYKRGGRCVAGVEIDSNNVIQYNKNGNPKWMRPITDSQYGEIPNEDANNIKILSIVTLINVFGTPQNVHQENVSYGWMEIQPLPFPADPKLLNQLVDNIHHSIFGNRGKAVSVEMASGLDYSLMFIHVNNASAYIDNNREKSKNRMRFTYYGSEYDFPITDPAFLDEFRKKPERFENIPDVYLTLSLGLEFEGWHHKLVAGVIIPTDSKKPHDVEGVSYMEKQKQIHNNAYAKWTTEDEEQLYTLVKGGVPVQELCRIFGRNEGAIRSRISKLGLDVDISTPHIFDKGANSSNLSQSNQPNWFDEYERKLASLLDQKAEIEEQINEVRAEILQGMESHGLEKLHSDQFSVSYTPAKTVMQFDSRTFRIENEELYFSYCKPKQREASIVVKRNVKEQDD